MKTITGYDPIKLTKITENIVIDGNKRKYANLQNPKTLSFE